MGTSRALVWPYDTLNADRHRGCAMRHPVVFRASDYLHKRMLEDAEKFVGHFCLRPQKACSPCTHSKYETITPPALQRMSGITKTSSQRWSRIRSASGVVGPFAASARMRHLILARVFGGDHAINRARNENIAGQCEKLVRID